MQGMFVQMQSGVDQVPPRNALDPGRSYAKSNLKGREDLSSWSPRTALFGRAGSGGGARGAQGGEIEYSVCMTVPSSVLNPIRAGIRHPGVKQGGGSASLFACLLLGEFICALGVGPN